ncbi:hypothetical protein QR685DRAFT_527728 [Neurospora intermedia]|uniref:Uncharacterized protein n=1 Tax=Neurospora intermedia TaxID=5142 RepID=A0ABR3DAX7_NEUIN
MKKGKRRKLEKDRGLIPQTTALQQQIWNGSQSLQLHVLVYLPSDTVVEGMMVVLKGLSHGSRPMANRSRDGRLSGQSWGIDGKVQKGNIQVPWVIDSGRLSATLPRPQSFPPFSLSYPRRSPWSSGLHQEKGTDS